MPVGVLGVVGLAAGGMITTKASVSDRLPATTTASLVGDLGSSSARGFSGTLVTQVSLGLPQLPALSGSADGSSMASLLSGAHTLRVWYGGPGQQRIALLGTTSESDLFHDGTDVWEWDSDTRVATHSVLPRGQAEPAALPSALASVTPQQLARQLIATMDPTTSISLGPRRIVADRSAYDLVLTPRQPSSTRVGSVHIAVDGVTKMPLGVQVYARGSSSPAIDVAFSDISFSPPPASYFSFAPPPGATVRSASLAVSGSTAAGSIANAGPIAGASGERFTTTGSGWSQVVEYRAGKTNAVLGGGALPGLSPVSGSWGRGRLLDCALFSALFTDDGRVFVGAVDPDALYVAAGAH